MDVNDEVNELYKIQLIDSNIEKKHVTRIFCFTVHYTNIFDRLL